MENDMEKRIERIRKLTICGNVMPSGVFNAF